MKTKHQIECELQRLVSEKIILNIYTEGGLHSLQARIKALKWVLEVEE